MTNNSPEQNKTLTPEKEFSEKLTFRDYLIATEQKANQPLPIWRLVAPLMLQVGLILAVPTQAMYTEMTGKSVILQTLPAYSNNVLQGSALSFDYNISRTENLRRLPGWRDWVRENSLRNGRINQGSTLYLILQEQQSFNRGFNRDFNRDFNRNVPAAWKPVRVSSNLPMYLPNNQVALKGNYQDGLINYRLENYFVSEEQRQQINDDLSQVQQNQDRPRTPIVVRVKVDPQGNAVPTSMWIGDRNYRF
ncbi:GDYXXLXY domain-containing protein [Sphaerospermopsis torques-reginae]|uniref:GDYXXLXY domain-containing protein n=1 Tax=Sphaerospermopsis torques-reginae ITEP-024 TaxID=984208 RepID=A0ABX8WXV2_9CYAN|nr:GDYXXLXY domain-containing protein [Sphaerospermopsis torques-reginae]QYX31229.1 GDYXXLXY domain-containing protein [Sphaerospermopsis torques-reginae ITEP-024]